MQNQRKLHWILQFPKQFRAFLSFWLIQVCELSFSLLQMEDSEFIRAASICSEGCLQTHTGMGQIILKWRLLSSLWEETLGRGHMSGWNWWGLPRLRLATFVSPHGWGWPWKGRCPLSAPRTFCKDLYLEQEPHTGCSQTERTQIEPAPPD